MLTTAEAAKYLGISAFYLRNIRHGNHAFEGPKYTVGRHARGKACYYDTMDLDAWAEKHSFRKKLRPYANRLAVQFS